MYEQAVALPGGNVSVVVRVGDTVRRTAGYWTPSVHHFLRYLRSRRFLGVPKPMGFDEHGREVLGYVEGEVGHYPLADYMWSAPTLARVGQVLRRIHDLSAEYAPPADARWQFEYRDAGRHEVIGHNDFAPYNMVFNNGKPKAIIDWDMAGPVPRIWDVAYAAYRFVPLSWEPDIAQDRPFLADPQVQGMRLRHLCDAYGLKDRSELPEMVRARLEHLCSHMEKKAEEGDAAFQKMIDEGHRDLYRRDIEALERNRGLLRF